MRRALIALGLIAGLLAALALAAPFGLRYGLARAGIEVGTVELGFGRLRLAEATLGGPDGQRLGRLEVGFSAAGLLRGRVDRVELEGLRLRGRLADGRLVLAGLEERGEGGGMPMLAPMPDRLVLRDGLIELDTPAGMARLPLAGELRVTGSRAAFGLTVADGRLTGDPGTLTGGLRIAGSFQGRNPLANLDATLDLSLAGDVAAGAGLAVRGLELRQSATLRGMGASLAVDLAERGTARAEAIAWQDRLASGPLELRLRPDSEPWLTLEPGSLAWCQALEAELPPFRLTVDSRQLWARAASLSLDAAGDRSGLAGGKLALAGGRVDWPGGTLLADGLSGEVPLTAGGLAPGQPVRLRAERLAPSGEAGWFVPLRAEAELRPEGMRLPFTLRLQPRAGGGQLTLTGAHDLASGAGQAEVALRELRFARDGLQPRQLAPRLGDLLRDVAGRLAMDGTIGWSAAGWSSDLGVLADDLSFTAGPARVERLNGVVRLDRLWPLATKPAQELAIALLDVGLPLTDGVVALELRPDGRLQVDRLDWQLAGGTVSAAPFSFDSRTPDLTMRLRADGLELNRLLALTRLDGISGEGRIDGVLPLRLGPDGAAIAGGELAAVGPGVLRYRKDAAPAALRAGGAGVELLLQALENFHYDALRITLDGRTDAAMDVGLHLKGANPGLHDGHPIEFNLNLDGDLANVLQSGLAGYRIPERIRERMQGFAR
jgi:hypothetical protein